MPQHELELKVKVEKSELEAFCETLDKVEGKLKEVESTFEQSSFNQPINENSVFGLLAAGMLGGVSGRAAISRAGLLAAGRGALGSLGGPVGLAISIVVPIIVQEAINRIKEDIENTPDIDFSNFDLSIGELFSAAVRERLIEASQKTVFSLSDEDLRDILFEVGNQTGTKINLQDLLKELPDDALFFKPERIQKVNEELEIFRSAQEAAEEAAKKLNETGVEGNKIQEEQIKLNKDNTQGLLDIGNTQSTVADANKQLTESIKEQSGELKNGSEIIELTEEELLSLDGKLAMVGDGLVAGAGAQKKYNKEIAQAEKTLDNYGGTTRDVTNRTESLDKEIVNQTENMDEYQVAIEKTDTAAENLGENGLEKIEEGAEDAGKALSEIDIQNLLEGISPEEIAKRLGVPVEKVVELLGKLKEGFAETGNEGNKFFSSLKELGLELVGTLESGFSDLIFSFLKGDFDSLKDIWKNTLDSMLRSFSNFVADILARPIKFLLQGNKGQDASGNDIPLTTTDKIAGGLALGGAALSAIGSQIENDIAGGIISGIGQTASFAAAGITLGTIIGGPAGAAIGAIIGAIVGLITSLVAILSDVLKKKPRLDLDFDQFRDEFGKSTGEAAKVMDFLDEEVFNNEIFNRSVSRQAGLGLRGGLSETIREAIATQILEIQDIIFKLPADLASELNEALLNTAVDIESEVKGDRLLEFDETKDIQQKFQKFIEGDLQARFVQSIRSFFVGAYEALGVLPKAAQKFIDEQFEEFQGLDREQRIEFGENFIAEFGAVVDAFNIISGNSPDSINGTINALKNLSSTLGFDAIPSIDELDASLEELISAAEFDPSVIEDTIALRNAIIELQVAIVSSISSIISTISSLNSTIISFGGQGIDLTGFLNEGIDTVLGLIDQEGLSLEDREALLGLGLDLANQLLAEEQAAFQAQLQAQQAAAEAQKSSIEARIDGLEEERDRIEEVFDERIDALNEELRIAEDFARLTESIRKTLDSILFSPESVLTGVEQVNRIQANIADLQQQLASTTDPEKQLEIAAQLEDAFKTLFDAAGDAFGVNSPEFVAIFDQVTGGLSALADLTEARGRSVEEINAEIERLTQEQNAQLEQIDAQIEALRDRLSDLGQQTAQNTFQASERLQELFEYIRSEYIRILEERFAQLEEVSEFGFASEVEGLEAIAAFAEEHLIVVKEQGLEMQMQTGLLEQIVGALGNAAGSPGGAIIALAEGGILREPVFGRGLRTGSRYLLGESGPEIVAPINSILPVSNTRPAEEMNVSISVNVNGGSGASVATLGNEIENMLVRSIRQGGRLRNAIQEAGARRLN